MVREPLRCPARDLPSWLETLPHLLVDGGTLCGGGLPAFSTADEEIGALGTSFRAPNGTCPAAAVGFPELGSAAAAGLCSCAAAGFSREVNFFPKLPEYHPLITQPISASCLFNQGGDGLQYCGRTGHVHGRRSGPSAYSITGPQIVAGRRRGVAAGAVGAEIEGQSRVSLCS